METFPLDFFKLAYKDVDQHARVNFGGSYEFVSRPPGPRRRIFTLAFPALKYFFTAPGVPNRSTTASGLYDPKKNLFVLEDFYNVHEMWKRFLLPIPDFGEIYTVRFNKPLEIPTAFDGGTGWVPGVSLEMIEFRA